MPLEHGHVLSDRGVAAFFVGIFDAAVSGHDRRCFCTSSVGQTRRKLREGTRVWLLKRADWQGVFDIIGQAEWQMNQGGDRWWIKQYRYDHSLHDHMVDTLFPTGDQFWKYEFKPAICQLVDPLRVRAQVTGDTWVKFRMMDAVPVQATLSNWFGPRADPRGAWGGA